MRWNEEYILWGFFRSSDNRLRVTSALGFIDADASLALNCKLNKYANPLYITYDNRKNFKIEKYGAIDRL